MRDNPLKEKWFAITRPIEQAASFAKILEEVEGKPIYFPLIEISPLLDRTSQERINQLTYYDSLIFVSTNSVKYFLEQVAIDTLIGKTLITTGKKTAQALIDYGLSVHFCPDQHFNSEALLAIKAFKDHVKEKKIAIIRGSNGRDYLREQLTILGATVDYIDIYSRHCPQHNLNNLKTHWNNGKLDAVLLTSASSTANFFKLAKHEDWINKLTILIGSPRMKSNIPAHFSGKILIAEDPCDETIFKKLKAELD